MGLAHFGENKWVRIRNHFEEARREESSYDGLQMVIIVKEENAERGLA